jgi:hypothetical protein
MHHDLSANKLSTQKPFFLVLNLNLRLETKAKEYFLFGGDRIDSSRKLKTAATFPEKSRKPIKPISLASNFDKKINT